MKRRIEVCLTPELLHLYDVKNSIVVVVDILRATSCMTVAMANEVEAIIPVSCLEECEKLQNKGCVGAAERDGKQADGFQIGNSPFSYMNGAVKGKTVAMTTTNGTFAINKTKDDAAQVIIGSFLNKTAVAEYLKEQPYDVLILCAGWKGKVNLEDTIYAGALYEEVKDFYEYENDDVLAAHRLYMLGKDDLVGFLQASSHSRRLTRLNIRKDVEYCLQEDLFQVIPVLNGDKLVKMENEPIEQRINGK